MDCWGFFFRIFIIFVDINISTMKNCCKCKEQKDVSKFNKDKSRKDGLNNSCKSCQKEKNDNYRSKVVHVPSNNKIYKYPDRDIYMREWKRNKCKESPLYRLKGNYRSRIWQAVKNGGFRKTSKTAEMLGCSPFELKKYLEDRFLEGMTWDNYGEWHVDHIIPVSSAKTFERLKEISHYINLQPLWAIDNIKKGARVI